MSDAGRIERCPDRGYCHGRTIVAGSLACAPGTCFRVHNAGPLSGVFEGDTWPAEVVETYRAPIVSVEVARHVLASTRAEITRAAQQVAQAQARLDAAYAAHTEAECALDAAEEAAAKPVEVSIPADWKARPLTLDPTPEEETPRG